MHRFRCRKAHFAQFRSGHVARRCRHEPHSEYMHVAICGLFSRRLRASSAQRPARSETAEVGPRKAISGAFFSAHGQQDNIIRPRCPRLRTKNGVRLDIEPHPVRKPRMLKLTAPSPSPTRPRPSADRRSVKRDRRPSPAPPRNHRWKPRRRAISSAAHRRCPAKPNGPPPRR